MPEDETSPRPSIWTPEVTLVPRGEVLYLKVVMMMMTMMMMTMMIVVMMVTLVPRGEVIYPKVSTKGVQF